MQTPYKKGFVRGREKSESNCMAKIYIINSLPKANLQHARMFLSQSCKNFCFNSYSELNECIYRVVKYSLHVIKNNTARCLSTTESKSSISS